MILKIGRRTTPIEVASFADASERYCQLRDKSGEGASTWPSGSVYKGTRKVAHVSYNGRVWEPKPWVPGTTLLYDPYPMEDRTS